MPDAAVATGLVDFVTPVDQVARRLGEIVHHRRAIQTEEGEDMFDLIDKTNRIFRENPDAKTAYFSLARRLPKPRPRPATPAADRRACVGG